MALLSTDGAAAAACAALRLGCAAAMTAAWKDVGRCVRRTPLLAMVNMSKPLLSSRKIRGYTGSEANADTQPTTSDFLTCGYPLLAVADHVENIGSELLELARADTRNGDQRGVVGG